MKNLQDAEEFPDYEWNDYTIILTVYSDSSWLQFQHVNTV
jgi:hypothetical protein